MSQRPTKLEPETGAGATFSRRELIVGGAASALSLAVGCGAISSGGVDSGTDGGTEDSRPVWHPIPDQVWRVGEAIELDLADYCDEPAGRPLVFSVTPALPAGLTLAGSIVTGTPLGLLDDTTFIATAASD